MMEYEPFGNEWRKAVMKMSKAEIVELMRQGFMQRSDEIERLQARPPAECAHDCGYCRQQNAEDERALNSYRSGLLKEWSRRARELNGR